MQFDPSRLIPTPIQFLVISEYLLTSRQFISMFSTVAGGFELSKILGQPVGPGKANWMAAAYSYVRDLMAILTETDFPRSASHKALLFSSAAASVLCMVIKSYYFLAASSLSSFRLPTHSVPRITRLWPSALSQAWAAVS